MTQTGPFTIVSPSPSLRSLVLSYWFVQDLAGSHQGKPIRTIPHPAAVLTINMGQPNADHLGTAVPRASLLGLQTHARAWISGPETYFVMVMLSVRGLISLFPYSGADTVDGLLDLGSLTGDRESRAIVADLSAAWKPRLIAAQLDRWLLQRFALDTAPSEALRFASACEVLGQNGQVNAAAERIGVSRRQLQRWSRAQIGLRPKEFVQLQRLQASMHSVQTRWGDPIAGFSDQAHQIREWRRRLGITPGAYRQTVLSRIAVENGGAIRSRGAVTHYF